MIQLALSRSDRDAGCRLTLTNGFFFKAFPNSSGCHAIDRESAALDPTLSSPSQEPALGGEGLDGCWRELITMIAGA